MTGFIKRIPCRKLLIILTPFLFVPLFFIRTSPGSLNFPELTASLGAVFLYLILTRLIGRLHLTSVLISLVIFSVIVFGLSVFLQPSASQEQTVQEVIDLTNGSISDRLIPLQDDSSEFSGWASIQSEIDSLASSGGDAIRNFGLFEGSGTVGMTLGALGEVTSATAEIFIRTVYAGSNVAQEDSIVLSEGTLRESEHPLKILALIAAVIFSIAIMASLKYLVLVERRKGTLLWFQLLVITFVLRILYVSLGMENLLRVAMAEIGNSETILSISPFYVLLFIFALINSFRTDWAHYLTRWRKYIALAGSLGVLVLSQSILRFYFRGGLTISSLALGTLIGCVFTILLIFSSVTFLKILFLLPSARLVDRKLNQLKIMDGLGQSIYSTFDEDKIVHSSVTLGRRISGADRCWAVKMDMKGFSSWEAIVRDSSKTAFPPAWHTEVLRRLEKSGGTILYNRYPSHPLAAFAGKDSPVPGSLIASMLKIRKKTFGIIYASTNRQFGFMNESKGLVETFARQVAAAIDNARLMETELERERYREELAIARSIQESLLPGELPEIENIDIAGVSVPSMQVGGDYYDVFPIPGGLYGIAIADVAGKGTAAALLMAALQSALHAIAPGMSNKAGETVQRLNTIMSRRMPDDKFITFFYGVLDPIERTISYCCAGHDPPVLSGSDGSVSSLSEGGLVLGVEGDAAYRTTTMKINPDDRLLLYTDGITESMNRETGEEFGTGRLVDFLTGQDSLQSRIILENLLDRLSSFRGEVAALDDMTLLMITCTAHTKAAAD
ncbi:MAG: SpoIIE family protein phosphatase [Candidatus Aegiribacteria sp.]|nr:SpoIIE family protein phosphatase [Candidatus Aegiribacteria sp.]